MNLILLSLTLQDTPLVLLSLTLRDTAIKGSVGPWRRYALY